VNIDTSGRQEWLSVLTPEAIAFVNELAERFSGERARLLARREAEQREFDAGKLPDFPEETRALRAAEWRVAAIPQDLLDRRVEITGPPERKMVIMRSTRAPTSSWRTSRTRCARPGPISWRVRPT
jgi:malate synthase